MPSQLILSTSTTRQYTALFLIEFSLELGCKSNDKRQRLNLNSHFDRVTGYIQLKVKQNIGHIYRCVLYEVTV